MSNFSYLSTRPEYSLFANSAIEAEKVFSTSPAMCAVGCRKALELAVKWVYAADKTITMPYKDNLQSLLHEPSFRFAVDRNVWSVLPSIVKAGNLAVHTGHSVSAADAVFSLRGLFDFIQWVDYCYGTDYVERSFDERPSPARKWSWTPGRSGSRKACWNRKMPSWKPCASRWRAFRRRTPPANSRTSRADVSPPPT